MCIYLKELIPCIYFTSSSSSYQGMGTLNKMVEQYKNRAVELETEKFEVLSSVQMRDQQVRSDYEVQMYELACFWT